MKYLLSVKEQENLDYLDITFICCAFMIGGVETVRLSLVSFDGVRCADRGLVRIDGGDQAVVRCAYPCVP